MAYQAQGRIGAQYVPSPPGSYGYKPSGTGGGSGGSKYGKKKLAAGMAAASASASKKAQSASDPYQKAGYEAEAASLAQQVHKILGSLNVDTGNPIADLYVTDVPPPPAEGPARPSVEYAPEDVQSGAVIPVHDKSTGALVDVIDRRDASWAERLSDNIGEVLGSFGGLIGGAASGIGDMGQAAFDLVRGRGDSGIHQLNEAREKELGVGKALAQGMLELPISVVRGYEGLQDTIRLPGPKSLGISFLDSDQNSNPKAGWGFSVGPQNLPGVARVSELPEDSESAQWARAQGKGDSALVHGPDVFVTQAKQRYVDTPDPLFPIMEDVAALTTLVGGAQGAAAGASGGMRGLIKGLTADGTQPLTAPIPKAPLIRAATAGALKGGLESTFNPSLGKTIARMAPEGGRIARFGEGMARLNPLGQVRFNDTVYGTASNTMKKAVFGTPNERTAFGRSVRNRLPSEVVGFLDKRAYNRTIRPYESHLDQLQRTAEIEGDAWGSAVHTAYEIGAGGLEHAPGSYWKPKRLPELLEKVEGLPDYTETGRAVRLDPRVIFTEGRALDYAARKDMSRLPGETRKDFRGRRSAPGVAELWKYGSDIKPEAIEKMQELGRSLNETAEGAQAYDLAGSMVRGLRQMYEDLPHTRDMSEAERVWLDRAIEGMRPHTAQLGLSQMAWQAITPDAPDKAGIAPASILRAPTMGKERAYATGRIDPDTGREWLTLDPREAYRARAEAGAPIKPDQLEFVELSSGQLTEGRLADGTSLLDPGGERLPISQALHTKGAQELSLSPEVIAARVKAERAERVAGEVEDSDFVRSRLEAPGEVRAELDAARTARADLVQEMSERIIRLAEGSSLPDTPYVRGLLDLLREEVPKTMTKAQSEMVMRRLRLREGRMRKGITLDSSEQQVRAAFNDLVTEEQHKALGKTAKAADRVTDTAGGVAEAEWLDAEFRATHGDRKPLRERRVRQEMAPLVKEHSVLQASERAAKEKVAALIDEANSGTLLHPEAELAAAVASHKKAADKVAASRAAIDKLHSERIAPEWDGDYTPSMRAKVEKYALKDADLARANAELKNVRASKRHQPHKQAALEAQATRLKQEIEDLEADPEMGPLATGRENARLSQAVRDRRQAMRQANLAYVEEAVWANEVSKHLTQTEHMRYLLKEARQSDAAREAIVKELTEQELTIFRAVEHDTPLLEATLKTAQEETEIAKAAMRAAEEIAIRANDAYKLALKGNLPKDDARFRPAHSMGRQLKEVGEKLHADADLPPAVRDAWDQLSKDVIEFFDNFDDMGWTPAYVPDVARKKRMSLRPGEQVRYITEARDLPTEDLRTALDPRYTKERGGGLIELETNPFFLFNDYQKALVIGRLTRQIQGEIVDKFGIVGATREELIANLKARGKELGRSDKEMRGRSPESLATVIGYEAWIPGEEGLVYVPTGLRTAVDRNRSLLQGAFAMIGRGVDAPIRVWKASVLALTLRWQLNNIIGGMMLSAAIGGQNPLQAFRDMSSARRMLTQLEIDSRMRSPMITRELNFDLGRSFDMAELRDLTASGIRLGEHSSRFGNKWADEMKARRFESRTKKYEGLTGPEGAITEQLFKDLAEGSVVQGAFRITGKHTKTRTGHRLAQIPLVGGHGRLSIQRGAEPFYRFNAKIDNAYRLSSYLHSLMRQVDETKVVTPEMQTNAYRQAVRVMGDFQGLSPVERSVMRRIFPFWAWQKHMAMSMVRILDNPHDLRRFVMLSIMATTANRELWAQSQARADEAIQEQLEATSPGEAVALLPIGERNGLPVFLNTRGMNPFADVLPFMPDSQQMEEQGGPAALTSRALSSASPLAKLPFEAIGVNTFTGRRLSAPTGENISAHELLLRQFPHTNMVKDLGQAAGLWERNARGAPLGYRRMDSTDPYQTGDLEETTYQRARAGPMDSTARLLGFSVTSFDPKRADYNRRKMAFDDSLAELKRRAVADAPR